MSKKINFGGQVYITPGVYSQTVNFGAYTSQIPIVREAVNLYYLLLMLEDMGLRSHIDKRDINWLGKRYNYQDEMQLRKEIEQIKQRYLYRNNWREARLAMEYEINILITRYNADHERKFAIKFNDYGW